MHFVDVSKINSFNGSLNLARKWRSQQFATIIGQDLVLRILKNSLYARIFFPVYLFSGTRGCGKTTTARVFAAAINCQQLSAFQQEPVKYELPCLHCASCRLMNQGKHPDFIEIDAASHTGVDNIRDIIEAASLLPVVGQKKIYLIDEAHMLSKAAFNAFLKILEEPPNSALFILATTQADKIIDTVRSRCFQLFFQPVPLPELIAHLKNVCQQETLRYDEAGLRLIAQEAAGSVRDALNMIERIRCATDIVSQEAVLGTLQHIEVSRLIDLLERVCARDHQGLILLLDQLSLERFCPSVVWKKLVDLIHGVIWMRYDLCRPHLVDYQERLKGLAAQGTVDDFVRMLERLYGYEHIFLKTTAHATLISMVLIALCQESGDAPLQPASDKNQVPAPPRLISKSVENGLKEIAAHQQEKHDIQHIGSGQDSWPMFLTEIDEKLDDPLVSSIFKQARFVNFDEQRKIVELAFSKKLVFLSDMLKSTQKLWEPVLHGIFGAGVICRPQFIDEHDELKPIEIKPRKEVKIMKDVPSKRDEVPASLAQLKKGKNARILLELFPGSLSLVRQHDE